MNHDQWRIPVLRTRPAKAAVNRAGCRLDLLVQLQTPLHTPAEEERQPVAIALVIDRSGSMAGGKLQAAVRAAQQLVRQLTSRDRVAVVSFDHTVRTEVPLTTPSAAVNARIGRIRCGGRTALFDGWREGLIALSQPEQLEGYQRRLLLLTDGQANVGYCDGEDVAPWVDQARLRGVSTSCIGLGEDYEERLLTAMAEAGDGNLAHLTDPGQLEAVFAAELEGLQLALGRDLQLRLTPGPGCRLHRIHNPLEPDGEGWLRLGLLQAGATPTLALQLQVAANADPAAELSDLLQVQARWRDAAGEQQQLEAVLRLPLVEASDWEAMPVDAEVQRQVLLQRTARQRQDAMARIDSGDADGTQASVMAALSSLSQAPASPEIEREQQLLGELLDLISTDQLGIARKVMGSQAYMRARGRKLRDQQGRGEA